MTGSWIQSHATAPYVGAGYVHDGNANKGESAARFTAALARGRYEVRVSWPANANRAERVAVRIEHADGTATAVVDQKAKPKLDGVFETLGVYAFDGAASVEISNADTAGFVIADAVQFVPVE